MIEKDALIEILDRLTSPTHAAPSSPLQINAMQQNSMTPGQPHVQFDDLKPTQVAILRDTLLQLEQDAAAIFALHKAIEARSKTGKIFYQRATAALAPINRFPAEVLARIFVAGKHLELNFSLRISWVARRWRDVALSTPDLWNRIPLTGLARVSTYLERSGSIPLDIEVDLRTYRVSVFVLRQCIDAVTPQRLRWRDVKILVGDHDQAQPILRELEYLCMQAAKESLSTHLNAIRLGVPHLEGAISSTYSSSLNIPASATLQTLELLGVNLIYLPDSTVTTFQNMRILSLSSPQNMHLQSHFFAALASMPGLVSLTLDQCTFLDPEPIDSSPTINLTKLTALELSYLPDEIINAVLARLHAPNLKRLGLYCHPLDGPSGVLNWEILQTKYLALSVLKLNNITSYATKHLVIWLGQLHALTTLTVVFEELLSATNAAQSAEKVLRALSIQGTQCCPALHTLKIGKLEDHALPKIRAAVEIRSPLKAGKVTVIMRPTHQKSSKHQGVIEWLNENLSRIKILEDSEDADTEDDSDGDGEEEFQ